MRDAMKILDNRKVDFEYDGEMSPDVALEPSTPRPLSVLPADRPTPTSWSCPACIPRTSPRG